MFCIRFYKDKIERRERFEIFYKVFYWLMLVEVDIVSFFLSVIYRYKYKLGYNM